MHPRLRDMVRPSLRFRLRQLQAILKQLGNELLVQPSPGFRPAPRHRRENRTSPEHRLRYARPAGMDQHRCRTARPGCPLSRRDEPLASGRWQRPPDPLRAFSRASALRTRAEVPGRMPPRARADRLPAKIVRAGRRQVHECLREPGCVFLRQARSSRGSSSDASKPRRRSATRSSTCDGSHLYFHGISKPSSLSAATWDLAPLSNRPGTTLVPCRLHRRRPRRSSRPTKAFMSSCASNRRGSATRLPERSDREPTRIRLEPVRLRNSLTGEAWRDAALRGGDECHPCFSK